MTIDFFLYTKEFYRNNNHLFHSIKMIFDEEISLMWVSLEMFMAMNHLQKWSYQKHFIGIILDIFS